MSLSLSFTGSVITACYFPLDLSDDDYELGLTNFETYNTIPNVDSTNNKFYYDDDDKTIVIPEGSYELSAIDRYLNAAISKRRRIDKSKMTSDDNESDDVVYDESDEDEREARPLIIRTNENTMRSEIRCESTSRNRITSVRSWNSRRRACYDRTNGTRPTNP
ncbi:hypothetical protein P5V15_001139 [Pogonomyrmex californicus]